MLKGREKSVTIVKNWSVKAKGGTDHVPGCLEPSAPKTQWRDDE